MTDKSDMDSPLTRKVCRFAAQILSYRTKSRKKWIFFRLSLLTTELLNSEFVKSELCGLTNNRLQQIKSKIGNVSSGRVYAVIKRRKLSY